jgi:hypothetical protein
MGEVGVVPLWGTGISHGCGRRVVLLKETEGGEDGCSFTGVDVLLWCIGIATHVFGGGVVLRNEIEGACVEDSWGWIAESYSGGTAITGDLACVCFAEWLFVRL